MWSISFPFPELFLVIPLCMCRNQYLCEGVSNHCSRMATIFDDRLLHPGLVSIVTCHSRWRPIACTPLCGCCTNINQKSSIYRRDSTVSSNGMSYIIPFVLSMDGRMEQEASVFMKQVAEKTGHQLAQHGDRLGAGLDVFAILWAANECTCSKFRKKWRSELEWWCSIGYHLAIACYGHSPLLNNQSTNAHASM